MRTINSLFCPKCGYEFPYFVRRSHTLRRGLFLPPWIRCPKCETLCLVEISWQNALWAWPATIIVLLILIAGFRSAGFGNGMMGGAVAGAAFGLTIGLGLRRGMRLVPLSGESLAQAQAGSPWRSFLAVLLFSCLFLIFAIITKRWAVSLIIFCVGLGVGVFHHFVAQGKAEAKPSSAGN